MKKHQMKFKTWSIWTLICSLLCLLLLAAVMYVTDPLLYFHKESDIFTSWSYNQLYSGPGVARHYDYDTVLTGSCMVQQFDTHHIDELYDSETVKLTYNGATAHNIKTILDICFETHPDIKRVILPLDAFASISPADEYSYALPEYMYEVTPLNSVKYLLNLNIFYHQVIPNLLGTLKGEEHLAMEAEPESGRVYNAQTVLGNYTLAEDTRYPLIDTTAYLPNTEENLQKNWLPLIAGHPDTEFVFFTPPYSILYWNKRLANGDALTMLESLRRMTGALLPYENVKIYTYMFDEELITELNNYRDILHFSPEQQAILLERMVNDEGRVTKENYSEQIDAFAELILSYDYRALAASYQTAEP